MSAGGRFRHSELHAQVPFLGSRADINFGECISILGNLSGRAQLSGFEFHRGHATEQLDQRDNSAGLGHFLDDPAEFREWVPAFGEPDLLSPALTCLP